jgi:hypothetical protein
VKTNWGKTMRTFRIFGIILALLAITLEIIDQMVAHHGFHLHPLLVIPFSSIILMLVIKLPAQNSN